ncbi:hypothetical protein ACQP26_19975 [Micromonospora sp. CA-248089]|uniref:hypothetical protein n=1 Tax=Micromonospora sp. CA-248089 TaxID=3239960 RepID=UPI003D8C939C
MSATAVSEPWTTTRLGWVFHPVSDRGHKDEMVLSVYRDHGVIPKDSRTDNFNRTPENLSNYQLVHPGDLVVNRMKAWQGSLGISEYQGIVSPDYEVLRPTVPKYDHRFLHSLLRSRALIDQYALRSTGIRPSQWRLYWDEMKTIEISLPAAEQQRAIVDYLDRETARIDTLIEEQQRLIEMLRERRASILSAAFDAGPSTEATKVGRLLAARPSYGVLVPRYVDEAEGVPFVRVGDLLNLTPERSMLAIVPEQSDEYSRTKIAGGEVLLGVVGKMGQATLAPHWLAGANVARAVAVLRCKQPAVAPLLCAWFGSRNFLYQAELATSGDSIQPTLGMKDLARLDINLPTDPDAAADLASRLANIDTLIEETERFIAFSMERRAALITAAVTGQIDVREMA